ncbi:MAG: cobalamin-dependent protein [Myxococcota bacterium]|nr:cobalamin-dependent protein [Myxococcota bacterium]
MLAARGIARRHLIEVFDLLETRLVGPDGSKPFHEMFDAARGAVQREVTVASDQPEAPLHGAYLAAALTGRRAEAWQLVVAARGSGMSVAALYQMLLVAQRRLGELWVSTTISVAQEHMASAVTQSVIARLYSEISGPRARGSVLLAGVEGELHGLPAQFAADLLELDGWEVKFIGTNTPDRGILDAVARHSPAVLGISTTMTFNLPRMIALAKAARAQFPTLPIVLGGRAIRGAGSLADELGVEVDDAPRRHVLSPRAPQPDLTGAV